LYVDIFWNYHEKTRGTFDFEGSGNITRFYELAAKNGLFLNVRFGPYICAEWSNGGLPVWLNHIPGMKVRSSSLVWKQEMERFVRFMLDLSRPFLAENGGPIILAQIENEYSMDDDPYIEWCGKLVDQLNTTIPWMMCNGKAASNTILACNGNDCYRFAVNETRDRPNEPLLWTENEGWFQKWAENPDEEPPQNIDMTPNDNRTAQDVAYSVARWFAIGGAHQNYYVSTWRYR
jgi:hypothetical protein